MSNVAKIKTIEDLAKEGKIFEIPAYQRLYEWEQGEIETLLVDLKAASKKEYFIGNVVVSENDDKFELIDGQQRLTTLCFVGFYLAAKKCGKWQEFIAQNEKLRILMPIRENEQNALLNLAKGIKKGEISENLSEKLGEIHAKIRAAFDTIEKWFECFDEKNLAEFAEFIYTKTKFVLIELAKNTDLNRFFVRMNNRGVQLEKHEILKAKVLNEIKKIYENKYKKEIEEIYKNSKSEEEIKEIYKNKYEKKVEKICGKYAQIWDIVSDMNKCIFQSASDRKALSEDAQNPSKNTSSEDTQNPSQRVKSIINFPKFLLHCYKIFSKNEVAIDEDKLLDIIKPNEMKANCEKFVNFLLKMRVLFDYFIIKDDKDDERFKIMRLDKSEGYFYLKKDGEKSQKDGENLQKDGEKSSENLPNLAMIQNYLRVARRGEKQNYHHWLTPFLSHLYEKISEIFGDKFDFEKDDKIGEKVAEFFAGKNEQKEAEFVEFLEKLDTNLAGIQLEKGEKSLLDLATKITQNPNLISEIEKPKIPSSWDFLNKGTGTPHYWFYRLEYYLWKKRNELGSGEINHKPIEFVTIADNFYFRNLNSIEHFRAQANTQQNKEWLNDEAWLDDFGNLALISKEFNSSLNAQNIEKKEIDIANQESTQSLKLVLMCFEFNKGKSAKTHKEKMLKVLKDSFLPKN